MDFRKLYLYQPNKTVKIGSIVLSSIFLAVSMPGIPGWWLLLFIALVPLFILVLKSSPWSSFKVGFLTGCLYHTVMLYWIVIVLHQYGGMPVWMAICGLLFLALYMSLYLALFCCLVSWMAGRYWHKERSLSKFIILAPLTWVALDWIRGEILTGFPWMDLSYGLYEQPFIIQIADIGGHHLVTFCIVLINCLVLGIIDRNYTKIHWDVHIEKRVMLLMCSILVFVGGYSYLRYGQLQSTIAKEGKVQVALVQGNIDQKDKWTADNKRKTLEKYLELSKQVLQGKSSELIVWPETAMPFFVQNDPLAQKITNFVNENNIWLLTGSPFYEKQITGNQTSSNVQYFNSALLLDPQKGLFQRYDKKHLVPFGEYVPIRNLLPFLEPLVETITDFTAGKTSEPLKIGKLRMGVLICFESIFPELARSQVKSGANLLINLTNDAWYGRSSAPYQTLAMAVFRSIENRRSLIRAANTGISCFVDPLGNIVKQTEIFTSKAILLNIPVYENISVFTRFGYIFGPFCFSITFAVLLFYKIRP